MRSLLMVLVVFSMVGFTKVFAKTEARVQVTRSVGTDKEDHITLHIQTKNYTEDFELNKSKSSVFSPNFKFQSLGSDENGRSIFQDFTPPKSTLIAAESTIYLNPAADSAVQVHHIDGTTPIVTGTLGGDNIIHRNKRHYIAPKTRLPLRYFSDVVDIKRKLSKNAHLGSTVSVYPELLIIFDNANYKTFKGNHTAMLNYLTLLIHSVNNRYANIKNPKIQFTISGILAISTPIVESFITNSAIPSRNTHDIGKLLDSYSSWVYANYKTLPEHDMAPLITGVQLQGRNDSGKFVDRVTGLSWLGGACYSTGIRDLGTSVSFDHGASFAGVTTLTHELAHGIGAPHDGQGVSTECPWTDGYIMSYEKYGTLSKFFFSKCSIAAINSFVTSTAASCLSVNQSPKHYRILSGNPGDSMSMTTQCQLALKNPLALVDLSNSPDSLCKNLRCKFPNPTKKGKTLIMTMNYMPADDSYCGISGSCRNGACVVQPSMTTQCKAAFGPYATVDTTQTAESLCQTLVCLNRVRTIPTNKPPVEYSPCGQNGRCISNTCSPP